MGAAERGVTLLRILVLLARKCRCTAGKSCPDGYGDCCVPKKFHSVKHTLYCRACRAGSTFYPAVPCDFCLVTSASPLIWLCRACSTWRSFQLVLRLGRFRREMFLCRDLSPLAGALLFLAKLQGRDRFTHRYCLQWSVTGVTQMEAKFSCDISLTPRDGLRTLHDSRRGAAREGSLSGGASVTLGGIGGFSDAPRLLRGCRDWEGPKVGTRCD